MFNNNQHKFRNYINLKFYTDFDFNKNNSQENVLTIGKIFISSKIKPIKIYFIIFIYF